MSQLNPQQQVQSLISQMKDAVNDPKRYEDLSDSLSVLTMAHIVPSEPEDVWKPYKLTKTQRRLVDALKGHMGKCVRKENILNALYFDDPNGGAEANIINVEVCYIRKKIKGSGYVINTHWGIGYSMDVIGVADPA